MNEAMYTMIDIYYKNNITAQAASYAYSHTIERSKLRRFVKAMIATVGPLGTSKYLNYRSKEELSLYKEDCYNLIREGGDLVVDVLKEIGSFMADNEDATPCHH